MRPVASGDREKLRTAIAAEYSHLGVDHCWLSAFRGTRLREGRPHDVTYSLLLPQPSAIDLFHRLHPPRVFVGMI